MDFISDYFLYAVRIACINVLIALAIRKCLGLAYIKVASHVMVSEVLCSK